MITVDTLINKRIFALQVQPHLSKSIRLDDKHVMIINWQEDIPAVSLPVWGQEAYEGEIFSDNPEEEQVVKFSIVPYVDETQMAFAALWLYPMGADGHALPLRMYFKFHEDKTLQIVPVDMMTEIIVTEHTGAEEMESIRQAVAVVLYVLSEIIAGGPCDEVQIPADGRGL